MASYLRLFLLTLLGSIVLNKIKAQHPNAIKKTWYLLESRSVPGDSLLKRTLYSLRFDEDNMHARVSPADIREVTQPYSVADGELKGLRVVYSIDSLSDSTLVLRLPDRRLRFCVDSIRLCTDSSFRLLGEFNGHPYYAGTALLMPTLSGQSLFEMVANEFQKSDHWTGNEAKVSFIVDEKGMVFEPKIIESTSAKLGSIALEKLQETSGKWQASSRCGNPVAVMVIYHFNFIIVGRRH